MIKDKQIIVSDATYKMLQSCKGMFIEELGVPLTDDEMIFQTMVFLVKMADTYSEPPQAYIDAVDLTLAYKRNKAQTSGKDTQ